VNEKVPFPRFLQAVIVCLSLFIFLSAIAIAADPFEAPGKKVDVTRYDVEARQKAKLAEIVISEINKMVFRVDRILVQAELKDGFILSFGSQQVVSSGLKTSWIPINDNYGFSGLEAVDFDLDGIEDAIATFTWGGWGSGWANGHICVSSKTRKAYLYESFSGNNYWHSGVYKMPEIRKPFFILEIPDFMPQFSVKVEGDPVSHPDCISFLFTQVWNGNGFSYKPITEFYKKLLPIVEDRLSKALPWSRYEPVKKEFYKLIVEDYRRAAQGFPVSADTRKSSNWRLLKEFNPEPKEP
jgi:hypothetical protein